MHLMVADVLRFDRPKGTKADMERNVAYLHTHFLDIIQQFRSKMQSGGGRCGGSYDFRIDRLITLLVLQLGLDIGRQGHFPQFL